MGTFFKIIGIAIAFAFLGALLAFAFIWVAGLLAIIFAIGWIVGIPIKVTKNSKVIGHLKRTKFYPLWSKY